MMTIRMCIDRLMAIACIGLACIGCRPSAPSNQPPSPSSAAQTQPKDTSSNNAPVDRSPHVDQSNPRGESEDDTVSATAAATRAENPGETDRSEDTTPPADGSVASDSGRAAADDECPDLETLRHGSANGDWTWQRCLLLAPSGPLVIDFRISVGNRSLEKQVESIREVVQHTFLDGETLRWENALSDPKFYGITSLRANSDDTRKQLLQLYDRNQDGQVEARELVSYLTRGISERLALVIDEANRYRGENRDKSNVMRQLDVNGDEVLNEAEIDAATFRLTQLDSNADFQVTLTEVLPREADPDIFMRQQQINASEMVVLIEDKEIDRNVIRQISRSYRSTGVLVPEDWPSARKLFDLLDTDRDGQLTTKELAELNRVEPMLVFDLKWLAPPMDDVAADVQPSSMHLYNERLREPVHRSKRGSEWAKVYHSGYRFEVIMEDPLSQLARDERIKALASQIGVTEEKGVAVDAVTTGPNQPSGSTLDFDHDGTVTWSDVQQFANFREYLTCANVRIRFIEPPDLWFAWLDEDMDQTLSEFELKNCTDRLKQLLVAGEKELIPQAIPNQLILVATRLFGEQDAFRMISFLGNRERRSQNRSDDGSTPGWFTAMDANADARLSLREFLGEASDFQRLDRDQDGYVSLDEVR